MKQLNSPEMPYDQVIIADNYQPRMEEITSKILEKKKAPRIDTFLIERENPDKYRDTFNRKIKAALDAEKKLLVVNNFFVALKNGYLKSLVEIEQEVGVESTKVIVSCLNRARIEYALRDYPGLIEVVGYDQEVGVKIDEFERAISVDAENNDRIGRDRFGYSQAS
jgi:hypothetical protein